MALLTPLSNPWQVLEVRSTERIHPACNNVHKLQVLLQNLIGKQLIDFVK